MFLDVMDFLAWSRGFGLGPVQGEGAMIEAAPGDIDRIHACRNLLARPFDSAVEGKPAGAEDMRVFNDMTREVYAKAEVRWTGDVYARQDIEHLLWWTGGSPRSPEAPSISWSAPMPER